MAVDAAWVPAVLLPSPGGIVATLLRPDAGLAFNTLVTTEAAVGGFGLAVAAGLALAALMSLSPVAERLLQPNLLLFQLLPKVVLGPLFVVWLGVGLPSRLAFATFVSLFPVAIGALSGLRAADPGQLRLCRAPRRQRVAGVPPCAFADGAALPVRGHQDRRHVGLHRGDHRRVHFPPMPGWAMSWRTRRGSPTRRWCSPRWRCCARWGLRCTGWWRWLKSGPAGLGRAAVSEALAKAAPARVAANAPGALVVHWRQAGRGGLGGPGAARLGTGRAAVPRLAEAAAAADRGGGCHRRAFRAAGRQ
ncbi:MAG: hypothetical protein WDN49_06635 [Acetobacteraceae bacterium]